ncbi:MAG TPA: aminopeptidase [Peptococcaceae bacterium]|nr:MAG: M18 family aminopeptidase [Clostridia bacterium 41_269]HBT19847.1 aminopeptidase [Peptococcaceae bacterium]
MDNRNKEKENLEELAESLVYKGKNVWETVKEKEKEKIFALGEEYKDFLDKSKTEREAVREIVRAARERGFLNLKEVRDSNQLKPGTGFFDVYRDKAVILGVMGISELSRGIRLVGSHLDSPRLDLKPQPLYEKCDLALFKTHYYGGIKKYQWTAIPLALHGIVVLQDGRKIEVVIGEDGDDPVFTITDLLPHLAGEQNKRRLSEAIKGEELNVLVGSIPLKGEGYKEKVKLAVLERLHRTYGITEEDFISAELEMVPAGNARDIGFDRGLIGAYGQDDRICVFASLKAVFDIGIPEKTAFALFVDKEEIGSVGNTGMQSKILEETLQHLMEITEQEASIYKLLSCSQALSADVNAAVDPTWEDVMDKLNAAKLGYGVCLTKYTGARGKVDASDAHAEYVAEIRSLFNRNGIIWQTGELGKVDQGGGGTIAKYLANLNMEVIDCGMPLLSMHAPFEVSSKGDLYMGYKGFKAFLMDS